MFKTSPARPDFPKTWHIESEPKAEEVAIEWRYNPLAPYGSRRGFVFVPQFQLLRGGRAGGLGLRQVREIWGIISKEYRLYYVTKINNNNITEGLNATNSVVFL